MDEHIRHSNLIEGINDKNEDEISKFAWAWLCQQEMINQPTLLELHRLITCRQLGTEAGKYRDVMVQVGGHIPPAPMVAQGEMYGWIKDIMENWKDLDPKWMHVRFEKIHPFIDGNGRTGRMLMWWHEKKLGRTPTLIRSNEVDRHDYYQWFREEDDLHGIYEIGKRISGQADKHP